MHTHCAMNSDFLLSSLSWRGYKTSLMQLYQLRSQLPERMTEKEWAEALSYSLAIPSTMGALWWTESKREWDWLSENELFFLDVFDPRFPGELKLLDRGPTLLTSIGDFSKLTGRTISVVGTRHPSKDAIDWLESEFSSFLSAKKDVVVVSGGARGIDQKSHHLAIRSERRTVCFLPSGLGQLYPEELFRLKQPLLDTGGVMVSTLSPFARMQKRFFLERNRYIAALSPLLFLVEAKRRSGSLITARWASLLDRTLAVLPCSPLGMGLGGLDLLTDGGALLIRDAYDLSQAFESSWASGASSATEKVKPNDQKN